jgi:hypothetical protein
MHNSFRNKIKEFAGVAASELQCFLSIPYCCYQAKRIYLMTPYLIVHNLIYTNNLP